MTENEAIDNTLLELTLHRINTEDEELKKALEFCEKTVSVYKFVVENFSKPLKEIKKDLDILKQYRTIGTVEQCRGAVLLQKQKKIRPGYRDVDEPLCPYCDKVLKHEDTCECGQRIDWSDTSETENT